MEFKQHGAVPNLFQDPVIQASWRSLADCRLWIDVFHYGPWWSPPRFLWAALEAYLRHMVKTGSSIQPLFVKHPFTSKACLGCFQAVESA